MKLKGRMGFHTLENISSSSSMTLHVYAHPIDICEVYNEKIGCFETVKFEHDSIAKIKDVTNIS